MDIKIEGFPADNHDYYQQALDVRSKVFVQEYSFDKHLEFDGKDFGAMHYILMYDGLAVGCARWLENESNIYIDRFCIDKSYRKRGLGIVMLKFILSELIPSKKEIHIYGTDETFIFFTQAGFKDIGKKVDFGKKSVRILKFSNG